MHHSDLTIVIVLALVFLSVTTVVALARRSARDDFLAGKPLDDWENVRRRLGRADMRRVMKATRCDRPVSPGTLTEVQVIYVRHLREASRRSLAVTRSRRALSLAGPCGTAGIAAWAAVTSTQAYERIWQGALAAHGYRCLEVSAEGSTIRRAPRRADGPARNRA
jgi:hypothetical protein